MKAYGSSPYESNVHASPASLANEVINEIKAANYLGVCDRTLRNLRRRGQIPFTRLGGRVVYLQSELYQWLLAGGTRQYETKGQNGIPDTK